MDWDKAHDELENDLIEGNISEAQYRIACRELRQEMEESECGCGH